METRHEACSAEGQPRNILTSIRTDSQAAAPRCHVAVIALSTDVAHFYAISHRISPARRLEVASRGATGAGRDRVNGTPMRAPHLLRPGPGRPFAVHQSKTPGRNAARDEESVKPRGR